MIDLKSYMKGLKVKKRKKSKIIHSNYSTDIFEKLEVRVNI